MSAPKPEPEGAICIVEPDHAVRDGLVSFIGVYNQHVCGFSDSGDLRQAWPDVHATGVLCAARLPDAGAVDLYQWLLDTDARVPFAMTVSKHQHREIAFALDAGIFHILHKPLLPGTALVRFIDHVQATAMNKRPRQPT
ncbi:MAG: response regulator [Pseudomonadales bacterium]